MENSLNFIEEIIEKDLSNNTHNGMVKTRFPPEPNGYLHIGHAKAICLNFSIAEKYNGKCNLRFDDTNPTKEDNEYVIAIKNDIKWLDFDWGEEVKYASNYFQRMYDLAETLIKNQKAYVCSLNKEETREYRGTLTEPGKNSPYRSRTIEENLKLFKGMKEGQFKEGEHVLRAKIDMSSPNMSMRDPMLYRILNSSHHRTGTEWHIYPMYDYAHCLEDSIENITHSLCTLEFANNRELYDWIIKETNVEFIPKQYEFARLSLGFTIMSKRKLIQLVEENHVKGWDDPRMPTISGMRRRGITPQAIKDFCIMVGIDKKNSLVDVGKLEFCIRNDLNKKVPRLMAVLDPLKVTIKNFDPNKKELLEAPLYPHDVPLEGSRKLSFSSELYIEKEDFLENPPKDWYRLKPGGEIRLRHAYFIKCEEVIKNNNGEVIELICSYDPETKSGGKSKRKVKGTIHWVNAKDAINAELRLYDRLFKIEKPESDPEKGFLDYINPDSTKIINQAKIEPAILKNNMGERYQFERQGYFIKDLDYTIDSPVFNLIVNLKDSWSSKKEVNPKIEIKSTGKPTKKTKQRPTKISKKEERARSRENNPELAEKYHIFTGELNLNEKLAETLTDSIELACYFEEINRKIKNPNMSAKWVSNEILRISKNTRIKDFKFSTNDFVDLINLTELEGLNSSLSKKVFDFMFENGGNPKTIIETHNLKVIDSEEDLLELVNNVLHKFPKEVKLYKDGKKQLFGMFIGKVMQESQGKADPKLLSSLLKKILS